MSNYTYQAPSTELNLHRFGVARSFLTWDHWSRGVTKIVALSLRDLRTALKVEREYDDKGRLPPVVVFPGVALTIHGTRIQSLPVVPTFLAEIAWRYYIVTVQNLHGPGSGQGTVEPAHTQEFIL